MDSILAGHYQIVRHLGGGGFGQTFLAQDTHLPGNPLCIVKKLTPKIKDPAAMKTAKRLFKQEAQTLHRLGYHDRIPRLLASFEQDDEFYLVQEFIEGRPLNQELIDGKPLSETETIDLLTDILQVLAFVHQQNVIHRDIKPANLIRRSRDRKIVLIDFGVVKEVSNQTINAQGKTVSTIAIGTPGYMPDEQLASHPCFSSDIYAVGMVGIQALTGLSPVKLQPDSRTREFSCATLKNDGSISLDLATILEKMVRYDYRQRYPNATEALQAIEQLGDRQTFDLDRASTTLTPSAPNPSEAPTQLTSSPPLAVEPVPPLDSQFLDRCQQKLAHCIGPFAGFLIEETIAKYPRISSEKLIEILAEEIPDSQQAKEFKQEFS